MQTETPIRWHSGWNVPGYLPEADPFAAETWEEARDALLFELERYDTDDESEHAQIDHAIAYLSARAQQGAALTVKAGVYVYWIDEDPQQEDARRALFS